MPSPSRRTPPSRPRRDRHLNHRNRSLVRRTLRIHTRVDRLQRVRLVRIERLKLSSFPLTVVRVALVVPFTGSRPRFGFGGGRVGGAGLAFAFFPCKLFRFGAADDIDLALDDDAFEPIVVDEFARWKRRELAAFAEMVKSKGLRDKLGLMDQVREVQRPRTLDMALDRANRSDARPRSLMQNTREVN